MLTKITPGQHQTHLFGGDSLYQLDPKNPLLIILKAIPWERLESDLSVFSTLDKGRPSIPIRRMVGLLILNQLENLSDEIHIDTTVPKKNITYPTDTKLAIKMINLINKIAKREGVQQRRTFVTEVKQL